MPEFKKDLQVIREEVNEYLDNCLDNIHPETLKESMRYGVLGGGKRLRAALSILISRMLGGKDDNVFPVAAAIEMIHCYSLIHDDLPALDDDEYRRGQLTTHKKFGEAVGVLAGDGLLTYAFWLIASKTTEKDLVAPLVETVARLAGTCGMVAGQVADIEAENQEPSAELVEFIHYHKTAALIEASCRSGAIAARASEENLTGLTKYGKKLGLAFQVVDDILDVCGSQEEMGKAVGKDEERGKITYPRVWGVSRARKQAESLVEQACQSIVAIPGNERLLSVARFVLQRKH